MPPPKPRLVLRIGVTGHRPNRFTDSAQERVRGYLAQSFKEIGDALAVLKRREEAFFDSQAPEVRIVSPLAEGADRIVAECGLGAGFLLDAVLPFSPEIYVEDFEAPSRETFLRLLNSATSKLVLPGERSDHDPGLAERAYETAGLMTLRQCDLLVAIWDGRESSGRGGTREILHRAIASRIPVLQFDGSGNGPFLLFREDLTPIGVHEFQSGQLQHRHADATEIGKMVELLAAPPNPEYGSYKNVEHATTVARARDALRAYLAETRTRTTLAVLLYPLFITALAGWRGMLTALWRPARFAASRREWQAYWAPLDALRPFGDQIRSIVMQRFAWADELADHYGQLHRSGYIANSLLAALAVWAGAVGRPLLELLFTAVIVLYTVRGILLRWHQRWCDYRQLSEQLRHLRSLALTGSSVPEARVPHAAAELKPGAVWTNWYYRASVREIGIPHLSIDDAYIAAAVAAIRDGEIVSQRCYHEVNARRMRKVSSTLEFIGYLAFWSTPVVCLIQLGEKWHWWSVGGYALLPLSVILPALGAAAFGIKVQGDFEGAAERSRDMARRLRQIETAMANSPMSFSVLSGLVEESVTAMSMELGDWAFVYRGKPLTLPG